MFERASAGWELAKQSWRVLKLDKELLLFPLMSGIACVLVLLSFILPLWGTGFLETVIDEQINQDQPNPVNQVIGGLILFAFYFVNYFVIVFFNSALISCAIIRFKGGNPNLMDGFSAASSRLPQIAGWALVAATVGVILRIIESRSEKVGAIVAGLLGMAWSAVTYFVVPVIVVERVGPIKAAKRSMSILSKTWGESVFAQFGIGFIVFLAMLVGIIPMFLGAMAIGMGMTVVGVGALVIGGVLLLLASLVSSALNSIIIGALYLYAAEGQIPTQFDDELFKQAFAQK